MEKRFAVVWAAVLAGVVICGPAAGQTAGKMKGRWVNEAGIMKFKVGRDTAEVKAQSAAAYGMEASGRVWYVEPGMSLDEVNALDLKPGEKVLFRRGGVWRGQLQPRSGKPGAPITYGAYGAGAKPAIQPSYGRDMPSDWREADAGVAQGKKLWVAASGAAADIGNIIFEHGAKGCAFKQNRIADLKNDLDFWCDPKTFKVYVMSDENPAKRFASIELCEKIHAVDEDHTHDVTFDGLWLRYSAAHGIGGGNTKRITVRNCDISWIGGGYLYMDKKGNGVRYGNGIEFWAAAEGHVVESNRIWEVWDAALTNQSHLEGTVQKGLTFRGNEVWNCEYSYEYWQQGKGAKTEDILVEGNVFRDAGKGWGRRQRWNPNACHLMFYDNTAETKNFVVKGNKFLRSEDTLFRLFGDWRKGLELGGNVWSTGPGTVCRYHGRPSAGLTYRYPDRLDQMHEDNEAEIQAQGTGARVFAARDLKDFLELMKSGK